MATSRGAFRDLWWPSVGYLALLLVALLFMLASVLLKGGLQSQKKRFAYTKRTFLQALTPQLWVSKGPQAGSLGAALGPSPGLSGPS